MYIERWWGNYIGGTDDTCTLIDYFVSKDFNIGEVTVMNVKTILQDFQLTNAWTTADVRQTTKAVCLINEEGFHQDIGCAINLLTDLAALIVESQKNGQIQLAALTNNEAHKQIVISLTVDKEEGDFLKEMLQDFIQYPLSYDLADYCLEEDMQELAKHCEEILMELAM